MKIERFEDLLAWREARTLTRDVYSLCAKAPLNRDFGLRDQLQRAAVSVMSNTAEGFERTGKQEKVHFLNIARASRAEVKSPLYVCLDNGCISTNSATVFQERCALISRLLTGLMRSISIRPSNADRRPQNTEHGTRSPEHRTPITEHSVFP